MSIALCGKSRPDDSRSYFLDDFFFGKFDLMTAAVTSWMTAAVTSWMTVVITDIGHLVGSGPGCLLRLLFTELSA
jgi:hypothetical protein